MKPSSSILVRGLALAAAALAAAALSAPASAATLETGDCGEAVRALQVRLQAARVPTGPADGCFGSATKHAVLALQLAHGLQPDGVAGPRTLRALRRPLPVTARSRRPGTHVEVDRARQLLVIVTDGRVRSVYAAATGKPGFETPTGTYRVYRKEQNGWSYQYQVPLPWVSYFVRGVAVHAGVIPGRPASHGCVRVPAPFAATIYRQMPLGSFVLVY